MMCEIRCKSLVSNSLLSYQQAINHDNMQQEICKLAKCRVMAEIPGLIPNGLTMQGIVFFISFNTLYHFSLSQTSKQSLLKNQKATVKCTELLLIVFFFLAFLEKCNLLSHGDVISSTSLLVQTLIDTATVFRIGSASSEGNDTNTLHCCSVPLGLHSISCEGSQVNCFLLTLCLGRESEMHTLISCFTRYFSLKILLQQEPVPPQTVAKRYFLNYVTLIFQWSTFFAFGLYKPTQSVHCSVFRMTEWHSQQRSPADPSMASKCDAILVQILQSSEGEDLTKAQEWPWRSWWKVA